jgi:ATP-dependent Clp protease protease subunit
MTYIPAVNIKENDINKTYDIYSLLLKERIIFINGEINEETSCLIISEILYLQALNQKETITIYISSPGGEVNSGLAIYDIIKSSPCPIETIGIGICASMGALILSSGTKGLRKAYPNCEIMIHQPLGGTQGQVSDLEIMTKRFSAIKENLNQILANNCSQEIKKVTNDCDRNYFMSANEAKAYHLIDDIVSTISS